MQRQDFRGDWTRTWARASRLALLLALCAVPASRAQNLVSVPVGRYTMETFRQGGVVFQLGHAGVVAGTETVRVSGRPLRAGRDYSLNATAGMLTLVRPITSTETLSVSYRFDPKQDQPGSRFAMSFGGFVSGLQFSTFSLTSGSGGTYMAGNQPGQELFGVEAARSLAGGGSFNATYFANSGVNALLQRFRTSSDPRTNLLSQFYGVQEKREAPGKLLDFNLQGAQFAGGTTSFRYLDVGKSLDLAPLKAQNLAPEQRAKLEGYEKVRGMRGMELASTLKPGGLGQLGLNLLSYTDGGNSASRHTVDFTGKRMRFAAEMLSIDAGMARLKDTPLAALGDPKNLLGRRQEKMLLELQPLTGLSLAANYQKNELLGKPDSNTHRDFRLAYEAPTLKNAEAPRGLGFAFLRNEDIVTNGEGATNRKTTDRLDLNLKSKSGASLMAFQETTRTRSGDSSNTTGMTKLELTSSQKAATIFSLGMERQRLGPDSTRSSTRFGLASRLPRNLLFSGLFERGSATHGDTTTPTAFTRLDLASDPQKQYSFSLGTESLKQDNGSTRSLQRIGLAGRPFKGAFFASLLEAGSGREGDQSFGLSKRTLKIETDPNRPNFITYDGLVDDQGLGRGRSVTKYQLALAPVPWFNLKASDDSVITRTPDQVNRTYKRSLHAETDPKKPITFVLDRQDEMKDNVRKLLATRALTGRLGKGLGIASTSFLKIDGGNGWEQRDELAFEVTQIEGLRLTANFVDGSTDKLASFEQSQFKLEGSAGKSTQWSALMATTENSEGLDRRDLAANVTTAMGKDRKLVASMTDVENGSQSLQETKSVRFEQPVASAVVGVELGSAKFDAQPGYLTNAIVFGTPESSKAHVRFRSQYRNYAGPGGQRMLAYNHTLGWAPQGGPLLQLAAYRSPDTIDDKGKAVIPMSGESLRFASLLGRGLKLDMGIAHERVVGQPRHTLAWNLGLQGSLGQVEQLELLFSQRIAEQWKQELPTKLLRIVYKREVDAENNLAFSAEAKMWRDVDPNTQDKEEVVGRFDWVRTF